MSSTVTSTINFPPFLIFLKSFKITLPRTKLFTGTGAPVPVKSFVRGRVILKDFKKIKNGGKLIVEVTVELKNSDKPACVAEQVFLIYE